MIHVNEYSITTQMGGQPRFEANIETNLAGWDYLMKCIEDPKEDENIDDLKVIFSGPNTICINTKTHKKAIISIQEDAVPDYDNLDRACLALIKYILYSQNRKKEYTKLCEHLNKYYDVTIYLAGIIGHSKAQEFIDKIAI